MPGKSSAVLFILTACLYCQGVMSNTGQELLQQCGDAVNEMQGKEHSDESQSRMCIMRLAGLMRVQTFFCIPQNTAMDEVITRFHQWLVDHPERINESANVLTIEALAEEYPCHIN